jgi:hypothetical protein
MAHSALDVMIAALGDDYAGYLRIVSTYAVAGEPQLNWLCDTASALCQCRRRKKAPPELAGPCDSQYIRDLPRRSSLSDTWLGDAIVRNDAAFTLETSDLRGVDVAEF